MKRSFVVPQQRQKGQNFTKIKKTSLLVHIAELSTPVAEVDT